MRSKGIFLKKEVSMKKKIVMPCLLLLFLSVLTIPVFADTGPKPSVVVEFTGIPEGETCYVTLLAEETSTGPYSWAGKGQVGELPEDHPEIWQRFVEYEDSDGFYFLQYLEECDESGQFVWDYYPPERFKILVYFPETDQFAVSQDIFEQYAFDSYFSADLSAITQAEASGTACFPAEREYGLGWTIFAFLVRLLITVAVEVLIALAFGYKYKNQLLLILAVNCLTQLLLNVILLLGGYDTYFVWYALKYFLLEACVFALEAVIYAKYLPQLAEHYSETGHPVWYALAANAASFVLGYVVSQWFPQVF
jgi:hypothetical protein